MFADVLCSLKLPIRPQGFHKAVKKHDKQLPHAPCQQFYMHILRTQPWVQGDQSSLLIKLSAIYAQLRGQPAETAVAQVGAGTRRCSI